MSKEKNDKIIIAAEELFMNRLGWATKTPYASQHFWHKLGVALYGEDDPRVKDMAPSSDTKQRGSMRLPMKKKKKG